MTIRVRLTILVAVTTAVLSGLSLWLGPAVLRDVVADGSIGPLFEELEGAIESETVLASQGFSDDDVAVIYPGIGDDDFEVIIGDLTNEFQSFFQRNPDWPFSIPEATTKQMVDEFGTDGIMYVSPLGLYWEWPDITEFVWPVADNGRVGEPLAIGDLAAGPVVVPALVLFELVDTPTFADAPEPELDELDSGEFSVDELNEFDSPELESADSRLVFERAEIDGVTYGLVVDASDELAAVDSVRTFLWGAAALLTILAAVATWIISGRALAPVGAMTQKVDLLSSTDLQERLPGAGRNDEIGRLADTLNRMLGRLESSDQQRRRFVSDASHELRTPLAVLTNQAEVAMAAPESTSLDALAEVVKGETGRLTSIVEDLLVLARHDEVAATGLAGSNNPSIVFDFDDVVLDEVARRRHLPVDGSGVSAGRVKGDPLAAARAVGHLLDNAARHARSKVAVSLQTVDGHVVLTVDDDGDGIAELNRDQVFERFTRLDDSRTRDHGGAGLGLSVVRATFAVMGGSVSVDTSPLGGARFEATLPAA